jgi:lactoylglutathione lyase
MLSPRAVLAAVLVGCVGLFGPVCAQETPRRPKILGISHAAFYVSDAAKARAFYTDFLGYEIVFTLPRQSGEIAWVKINDRQTIELFSDPAIAPEADRLYHVALETDDAEAMRVYLRAQGVKVPDRTPVGKIGNANFFIQDPNGNTIEIVQYLPDGWTAQHRGKALPETRVSSRLRHVGVMVGQLDASLKFYGDILGMKETWRGSAGGKQLNWVNLQVPDGDDYLEFMLYAEMPTLDRMRTMHHVCLEVDDVAATGARLQQRSLPAGSKPPTPLKVGINGKRQINYFDPDGTRVEIMEPRTLEGRVVPPSAAPPPAPLPRPIVATKYCVVRLGSLHPAPRRRAPLAITALRTAIHLRHASCTEGIGSSARRRRGAKHNVRCRREWEIVR